jgi:putative transposase
VLAVELANRESRSSWRDFLLTLRARGLNGVEFVVADDHAGLRAALREALPEAAYQRCYVHYADLRIMPSDTWKLAAAAVIAAMGSA